MTRPRVVRCSNPDCPHEKALFFNDWVRDNCPKPWEEHFTVFDLDIVFRNHDTKKLMLVEKKTRGAKKPECQEYTIKDLVRFINAGIGFFDGWEFLGFHTVMFENTNFTDGKCYFDDKEITEAELKKKLTF